MTEKYTGWRESVTDRQAHWVEKGVTALCGLAPVGKALGARINIPRCPTCTEVLRTTR